MQGYDDEAFRQLMERYCEMSDGELEQLAAEAHSLTDAARSALQREVSRRGLSYKLDSHGGALTETPAPRKNGLARTEEVEYRELATIGRFNDLATASLARGFLESAGIQTFLVDDHVGQLAGAFGSSAYGGIKLQVSVEDVEAAVRLLEQGNSLTKNMAEPGQ